MISLANDAHSNTSSVSQIGKEKFYIFIYDIQVNCIWSKGKNCNYFGQDKSYPHLPPNRRRIISFTSVRRFTNWSRA